MCSSLVCIGTRVYIYIYIVWILILMSYLYYISCSKVLVTRCPADDVSIISSSSSSHRHRHRRCRRRRIKSYIYTPTRADLCSSLHVACCIPRTFRILLHNNDDLGLIHYYSINAYVILYVDMCNT